MSRIYGEKSYIVEYKMSMGEGHVPPQNPSVDEVFSEPNKWPRRDVLAGLAVGIGALTGVGRVVLGIPSWRRRAITVAIDAIASDEAHEDTYSELALVEGTGLEPRQEHEPYVAPWICAPGLGVGDGRGVGGVVRDNLLGNTARYTEVYGIIYPEKGIDLNEFAEEIRRVARGHGRVNAAVESAGLLVFLAALHLANEKNIEEGDPVIQLDILAGVSNPLGLDYVEPKKREGVKFVAEHEIDGNRFLEILYRTAVKRGSDDRWYDMFGWLADLRRATEEAGSTAPPKVYTDCLNLIYALQATALLSSLAAQGALTKRSEIHYYWSFGDDVVLAERAFNDLAVWARAAGVKFGGDTYEGRHGDTVSAFKKFGPTYQRKLSAELKRQKTAESSAVLLLGQNDT